MESIMLFRKQEDFPDSMQLKFAMVDQAFRPVQVLKDKKLGSKEINVGEKVVPSEFPEKLLKLDGSGSGSKDSSSHESEAEASLTPSEREGEIKNGVQEKMRDEEKKDKDKKRKHHKSARKEKSHDESSGEKLKSDDKLEICGSGEKVAKKERSSGDRQKSERKPRSREREQDKERRKNRDRKDLKIKDKKCDRTEDKDKNGTNESGSSKLSENTDKLPKLIDGLAGNVAKKETSFGHPHKSERKPRSRERTHKSEREQNKERRKYRDRKDLEIKEKKRDRTEDKDKDSDPSKLRENPVKLPKLIGDLAEKVAKKDPSSGERHKSERKPRSRELTHESEREQDKERQKNRDRKHLKITDKKGDRTEDKDKYSGPSKLPQHPENLPKLIGELAENAAQKESSSGDGERLQSERKPRSRERTHESECEQDKERQKNRDRKDLQIKEKKCDPTKDKDENGTKDNGPLKLPKNPEKLPKLIDDGLAGKVAKKESSSGERLKSEHKPRSRERGGRQDKERGKNRDRKDLKTKDKDKDKNRDRKEVKNGTNASAPSKIPKNPDKLLKPIGAESKDSPSLDSETKVGMKPKVGEGVTKHEVQAKKQDAGKKDKDKKQMSRDSNGDDPKHGEDKDKIRATENDRKRKYERDSDKTLVKDSDPINDKVKMAKQDKDCSLKVDQEKEKSQRKPVLKPCRFSKIRNSLPPKIPEKRLFPPRFQSEFMRLVFQDTEPDFIASLHFRPKHKKRSHQNASEAPKTTAAAASQHGMKRKVASDADKGVSSSQSQAPKKMKLDLNKDRNETKKSKVETMPDKKGTAVGGSGGQTSTKPVFLKPAGTKKRTRTNSMDSAYDSDRFEKSRDKKKARLESRPRKTMDKAQFEKARELAKKINEIRDKYKLDLKSKQTEIRQRAVAMYFIDKLAFRVGDEMDEDMADAVECCSLLCEHVKLHDEKDGTKYVVEFDCKAQNSARYQKQVPVDKQVFKSLKIFVREKKAEDALFDWLKTPSLNKHLEDMMEGLTAKVFRAFNSSQAFQKKLNEMTPKDGTLTDKLLAYNGAKQAATVSAICKQEQSAAQKSTLSTKLDMEKGNEASLDASSLCYLDPRISIAWCKQYEVPIEKVYNETQRSEMRWAVDETDKSYSFN